MALDVKEQTWLPQILLHSIKRILLCLWNSIILCYWNSIMLLAFQYVNGIPLYYQSSMHYQNSFTLLESYYVTKIV